MVDAAGNSYVTGHFITTLLLGAFTLATSDNSYDDFVAKLDPTGTVRWAVRVASTGGTGPVDNGTAIAPDAAGNVYVAGEFGGNSVSCSPYTLTSSTVGGGLGDATITRKIFVARLDNNGNWQWAVPAPIRPGT